MLILLYRPIPTQAKIGGKTFSEFNLHINLQVFVNLKSVEVMSYKTVLDKPTLSRTDLQ